MIIVTFDERGMACRLLQHRVWPRFITSVWLGGGGRGGRIDWWKLRGVYLQIFSVYYAYIMLSITSLLPICTPDPGCSNGG